jgi:hypothetical protein
MTARNRQHGLQSIFHSHWSPAVDSQLLTLRDQGISLDRIAMALMRQPKAVEQRWHRLRVVPDIRKKLREFGSDYSEYPVESSDGFSRRGEVSAP